MKHPNQKEFDKQIKYVLSNTKPLSFLAKISILLFGRTK
jgi:hypothetical protein